MLKLTLRRFSIAVLSTAVGFSSAAASAQLTEQLAPPRKDTARSNDVKPEADSRAGGALSVDADPIEGAEIIDGADIRAEATDGDLEPRVRVDRERGVETDLDPDAIDSTFSGLVTGVSADRITVQLGPPRVPKATEQIFKISTRTPVMINGQNSKLSAVKKGQFVRIQTMPGDPDVAARIVVATPPNARNANSAGTDHANRPPRSEPAVSVTPGVQSEDESRNFDVFPDDESAPAERGPQGVRGRAQMAHGNEEAVLPLGIEVFGPGEGALVTEMLVQGPASRSGVQIGDYITQVNHQPVGDPEQIEQLMADNAHENGAVTLTLMRDGEQMEVTVEPVEIVEGSLTESRMISAALAPYGIAAPVVGGVPAPGAAGAFAPGLQFPLGGTVSDFRGGGALITGEAGQLVNGVQPNDVITAVNGQPIRTGDDLIRALKSGQDDFTLTVNRNGQPATVNVPREALIQATTQRTGAQRATGTLSGTNATTNSGPLQRATGTLNGRVGTDRAVQEALTPDVPAQQPTQRRSAVNPNTGAANPNAAAAQNAATRAAAERAAAAGSNAATGGAVQGGAAATGGAATGGATTGGTTTTPQPQ